MHDLARDEIGISNHGHPSPPDFAALIFDVMARSRIGLRHLANATNIPKSRLGLILHRNPNKRAVMTLRQLHAILSALNISYLEAAVHVEAAQDLDRDVSAQHGTLIGMLCKMFHALPATIIAGLNDIDGVDGTEVRSEWADPLRRAVAKRVVHEIGAVVRRRSLISDFDVFN